MKLIYALLIVLALAGCSGKNLKSGGDHEVVPLIGNFEVNRFQFRNGLKLLVVEDHSSPTFAYHTWFRVGSRDEDVGKTGLAHLFEHMMFKETKNLKDGEFDRILESAGAEGENAFTNRDYTAYVQEMPKDKLELIAKLESDRMSNLLVDQKAFKTETEVVQNERRLRTENSPDGTLYQELFNTAYTKHPYHWPVIGYQKDLDSMNAEDARNFYKAHYSPNNAIIVVIGDVDADDVRSMVEKYYGAIPSAPKSEKVIPVEPAQTSIRRKTLKLNIQIEKLLMGYHIGDAQDPDSPAFDIFQSILAGGKSSRLHRALVETGIANSVEAYEMEDKDPSLFVFGANMQSKKSAAQAESVILKEVARLGKELVDDKELERARNRMNFSFYQGLDSNSEKARFLGQWETVAGTFEAGLASFQKIQTVTAADVQAIAKKYFNPKNRTVVIGVPK